METPAQLPPSCQIRPAKPSDIWAIRKLVLMALLDPTQLRSQQFWLIECEGTIVACGQLRQFADAQELGSLVVAPAWRDRGLGKALTQHLIQQAYCPLYLECLGDRLATFYGKFGFVPVAWDTLPPALQQKFGFTHRVASLLRLPLVVMVYQGDLDKS